MMRTSMRYESASKTEGRRRFAGSVYMEYLPPFSPDRTGRGHICVMEGGALKTEDAIQYGANLARCLLPRRERSRLYTIIHSR